MTKQRHPGIVLAAVCISLTAITMNISLLNVGIPTLSRELNASNTGLEWIVDSYALVFAGFLLAAGSLGDRFGRSKMMASGLLVFGVCSALAGASHSVGQLIAARCGMGLGAAFVMPMTLSILTDIYSTEGELRRAVGIWAATASAGSIIAPLLAGALLTRFWWGALFLVNVPLALSMALTVILVVPNSAPRRDVSTDWLGVVLSVLFSSGLVFALIEGPDLGWSDPLVVGCLAGAAAATAFFCFWELRCRQPLVDIRCFRITFFSVGCGVVGMQYFFSFGIGFVVTQYLQLVLGFSALDAGITLVPAAAVVMVVAPLGARAFGRFGARNVTTIALLIAALGAATMSLAQVNSTVAPILTTLILVNLAVGLMAAGTTSMVMSAVPPDKAGMASGTQSTTRQLGGALGIALLGSILAARYTANLAHALSGTPAQRYLSTAQRSLGEALEAVPGGGAVQDVLTRVSREAFVAGLHTVAWTIAAVAAASAVVVFLALKPAPSRADDETDLAMGDTRVIPSPALSPDDR
jgi:EmrB/QacA subfamily drug resistance transporter